MHNSYTQQVRTDIRFALAVYIDLRQSEFGSKTCVRHVHFLVNFRGKSPENSADRVNSPGFIVEKIGGALNQFQPTINLVKSGEIYRICYDRIYKLSALRVRIMHK